MRKLSRKQLRKLIQEAVDISAVSPSPNTTGTDSNVYFYENNDHFNMLIQSFIASGTGFGNACERIVINILRGLKPLNTSDDYPFAFGDFPFADTAGPIISDSNRQNLKEQIQANLPNMNMNSLLPGADTDPTAGIQSRPSLTDLPGLNVQPLPNTSPDDVVSGWQQSAGQMIHPDIIQKVRSSQSSNLVLYSIKTSQIPDRTIATGNVNVTAPSHFINYCQAVDAIYGWYVDETGGSMTATTAPVTVDDGIPSGLAPGWIGLGLSGIGTLAIGCHGIVFRCDIVTPGQGNFLSPIDWIQSLINDPNLNIPSNLQTSDGSIAQTVATNANTADNLNAPAFNDNMLGGQGNIQSFYFAVCKQGAEEAARDYLETGEGISLQNFNVLIDIINDTLSSGRNANVLKKYAREIGTLSGTSNDPEEREAAQLANRSVAQITRDSDARGKILTQVARKIGNQVADKMQNDYLFDTFTKRLAARLIQNVAMETKSLIEDVQAYTEEDIQQFAPDFEGAGRLVTPGSMTLTEVGDRLMQSANSILQLAQLLNEGEIYADSNGVIQGSVPQNGILPRGYTRRSDGIIVPTSFQNESTQKSKPTKTIDRTEKEEFEKLFDNPIFETSGYKQMGSSLALLQDVIKKINPNFDFEYLKNIVDSGMKYLKTLTEGFNVFKRKRKYSLLDLLEEQMVPMPALGAGSAQYDSRRVEDPFDIDQDTMSLLGLLDADEVDIDETDVDTDLDGIPNRLDDEDDTPQGFGDMMERFLRNTHQKEDNYKKEKQERQFGLSHAALLKKKYYGRY